MKKKLLIVAALIVLVGAGWGLTYLYQVRSYQANIKNLTISNIPFSSLSNGTYVGEYDVRFIDAKVQVSVHDGKVTRIDLLKHKNGHGAPAEAILKEIVAKQTLDVDAVSGASNSSKVLKKAVELALVQGEK